MPQELPAVSLDVLVILNECVHYVINKTVAGCAQARAGACAQAVVLPTVHPRAVPAARQHVAAAAARDARAGHIHSQGRARAVGRPCHLPGGVTHALPPLHMRTTVLGRWSAARAYPALMRCLCHVIGSANKQSHGPPAGRVSGSSPSTLEYGVAIHNAIRG